MRHKESACLLKKGLVDSCFFKPGSVIYLPIHEGQGVFEEDPVFCIGEH